MNDELHMRTDLASHRTIKHPYALIADLDAALRAAEADLATSRNDLYEWRERAEAAEADLATARGAVENWRDARIPEGRLLDRIKLRAAEDALLDWLASVASTPTTREKNDGYAADLPTFDQVKEWAGASISDDGAIHIVLAAITELRPVASTPTTTEPEHG